MCDRCKVLEKENKELRAVLDGAAYALSSEAQQIAVGMCIPLGQAHILAALYRARYPIMGRDLNEAMPVIARRRVEDSNYFVARSQVHHLRRNLGKDFIKSQQGVGYWLGDKARERVKEILS